MSETSVVNQGSLIFLFPSEEAAQAAYLECLAAFKDGGIFRDFKIKTQEKLSPDMPIQPQQPWCIPEHCCIVCGIAELPEEFSSDPAKDDVMVSPMPPMVIGNRVKEFGLDTVRLQAPKIVPETKIHVLHAVA